MQHATDILQSVWDDASAACALYHLPGSEEVVAISGTAAESNAELVGVGRVITTTTTDAVLALVRALRVGALAVLIVFLPVGAKLPYVAGHIVNTHLIGLFGLHLVCSLG